MMMLCYFWCLYACVISYSLTQIHACIPSFVMNQTTISSPTEHGPRPVRSSWLLLQEDSRTACPWTFRRDQERPTGNDWLRWSLGWGLHSWICSLPAGLLKSHLYGSIIFTTNNDSYLLCLIDHHFVLDWTVEELIKQKHKFTVLLADVLSEDVQHALVCMALTGDAEEQQTQGRTYIYYKIGRRRVLDISIRLGGWLDSIHAKRKENV